ncbi:MAG: HlyC/CorC family transporter [Gammaproteobacteria bacterium]
MSAIPTGILLIILILLIFLSAFFSASETGLMALNRYRLRQLAHAGHRGALRVSALLARPDRIIGLLLLGNHFVNILASAVATLIAIRWLGLAGLVIAAILLTLILLIFAEVGPKTYAALYPERTAFPASRVLSPLLRISYPIVWGANAIANIILKPLGVRGHEAPQHPLNAAELRAIVMESSNLIPKRHRNMLLNILDLDTVTVDDIMVPRGDVDGVDLDASWQEIVARVQRSQYTRLVVYRGDFDSVVGVLHVRSLISLMHREREFSRTDLERLVQDPYFVPAGTSLQTQLLNFQKHQQRIGLVVDEYGDFQGLVTLEDILEEIVGEFTNDPLTLARKYISPQPDGSYLVDGGTPLRLLNRSLDWDLPIDGPKTLNGLIMEHLETIPEPGVGLLLGGRPLEIVKVAGKRVKTVIVQPPLLANPAGADTRP